MFIYALAGLVLFRGSVLQGIIMLVLAAGILAMQLIFRKKLPTYVTIAVYAVAILGYLACGLFQGSEEKDMFLTDHRSRVASIEKLTAEGETEQAKEKLDKLIERYGESDETVFLEAGYRLKSGENGSAVLSYLKRNVQNKNLADYFLWIADCYHAGTGYDYDYYLLEKQTLVEGAQKYPDNFLLNFRAGCLCAEKKDYYNAEYYLLQAFILAGDDDAFTPCVLAKVYLELDREEYAYAMMSVADKRGAAKIEQCKNDPIYAWYTDNLELVKNAKKNEGSSSSGSGSLYSIGGSAGEFDTVFDRGQNSLGSQALNSGFYNRGNTPSPSKIPEVKIGFDDFQKALSDIINTKNRLQAGDITPESNVGPGFLPGGGNVNRIDSTLTSLNNLANGGDAKYRGETNQALYRALQAENIVYNTINPSSKTPGVDQTVGYLHDKATQLADDPKTVENINRFYENNRSLFEQSDRDLRRAAALELLKQGYSDKEVEIYVYLGWDAFQKYIENKQYLADKQEKDYRFWKKMAAYARIHGFNPQPAKGIGIEKPNVYFYPEEKTEIRVTFGDDTLLTVSIPEYGDGWNVSAQPDGTLTNLSDGSTHGFLYYEAGLYGDYYQYNEGFAIPKEGREAVFREILTQYGLNDTEISDFTEYWTERLDPDTDYIAYPQLNDTVDAVMPVEITPTPDSILRLWFIFEEDVSQDYETPKITEFEREGYSVVEWGGAVR